MHCQKSVTSYHKQHNQSRPYLGVRVKEPVKELLKRKRGNVNGGNAETPMVASTYQSFPSFTPVVSNVTDLSYVDTELTTSPLPIHDEGTFYTSWISQPPTATFQPITQWTACPEYISHETVSCPYTGDMYVQPMCQGYTVVGPPSVLTYTSQPLLTNFATRSTAPGIATQIEYTEQQTPFTYFPWAQPIPTLPATTHTIPYQPTPTPFQGQQFVPIPISVPDPVPQEQNDTRRELSSMPIEKLLQEDEENDSYAIHHTLSIAGL
ncbi:POU domain class 2-associating factor 1 [Spea bombifrons]|uniref:POU domain class 2-associating factor 1 n=1 Tax=Spea bombifrons TaxID=233779 RepID=UPI00234B1041|nr:POU domain class 2-associating factor 1 [Spea bombifrons]